MDHSPAAVVSAAGVFPALLASMDRYAAADRAYLFGWTDEKRLALHMTHEWCAPGVRPTMDEMQDLRMADMPNWAPGCAGGRPSSLTTGTQSGSGPRRSSACSTARTSTP